MGMRRLRLNIEHLALNGLDPVDAAAVAAGIRSELERRLADPQVVASLAGGERSRSNQAATVRIPHRVGAAELGRLLAGGILAGPGTFDRGSAPVHESVDARDRSRIPGAGAEAIPRPAKPRGEDR